MRQSERTQAEGTSSREQYEAGNEDLKPAAPAAQEWVGTPMFTFCDDEEDE